MNKEVEAGKPRRTGRSSLGLRDPAPRTSHSSLSSSALYFTPRAGKPHVPVASSAPSRPGMAPVPICSAPRDLTCGPRRAQPTSRATSLLAPGQSVNAVAGAGAQDQARRNPAHVPRAAHVAARPGQAAQGGRRGVSNALGPSSVSSSTRPRERKWVPELRLPETALLKS